MIRRPSFHAAMAGLALVAALLLAAIPTLGRLASRVAQPSHAMHPQLVAPHVADAPRHAGHATQDATAHQGDGHHGGGHQGGGWHAVGGHATAGLDDAHPGAPPAPPHDHGDPDCAYCPLLLSMLVVAAWLPRLRAAAVRTRLPSWPAATPRAFRHPCGLGSRGPPAGACLRA